MGKLRACRWYYGARLIRVGKTLAGDIVGVQTGELTQSEKAGKYRDEAGYLHVTRGESDVEYKKNELNRFYFKDPTKNIEERSLGSLYVDKALISAYQSSIDADISGLKILRGDWIPITMNRRIGGKAKNGSIFYANIPIIPGFSTKEIAEQLLPYADINSVGLTEDVNLKLQDAVKKFLCGELPFSDLKQLLDDEEKKER